MKITLNQTELAQTIKLLQKVLSKKTSLSNSGEILLQTNLKKQTLSLEANDNNWGLKINLIAQFDQDIRIILPSKIFTDAALIGENEETIIDFDEKNNKITLQNDSDKVAFSSLPLENYTQPQYQINNEKISLSTALVKEIKNKIVMAASIDLTRPQLTGVYFNFLADKLEIVGTDGFRLAILDTPKPQNSLSDQAFLIPAPTIAILESVLDKNDNQSFDLSLDFNAEQVAFTSENFIFWVNMIKISFPPYEKIIPPDFQSQIEIDREELLRTLQKAALFARETSNTIQLTFSKKTVLVKTQSETGLYESEFDILTSFDQEIKTAFNIKYLVDFLNTSTEKNISLSLNDAVKPILLSYPKDKNYRYIVMPFKIRS